MLFNPKHRKAVRIVWIALGILIMISMTLLYTPIFGIFSGGHSGI